MNNTCREIVLGLTLCMSCVGVTQAADCKYAENSVDEISKVRVVVTEREQLTHWMRELRREMTAYVSASSDNGETYLRMDIEYVRDRATEAKRGAGENAIAVAEGAELMIAMSDGNVLKLPASNSAAGNTSTDDPHPDWFTTRASLVYDLDDITAEALSAQGAKAVRVMTDDGHYDVKIHKRNVDVIRKAVDCVR